jgi:hypothetical protein
MSPLRWIWSSVIIRIQWTRLLCNGLYLTCSIFCLTKESNFLHCCYRHYVNCRLFAAVCGHNFLWRDLSQSSVFSSHPGKTPHFSISHIFSSNLSLPAFFCLPIYRFPHFCCQIAVPVFILSIYHFPHFLQLIIHIFWFSWQFTFVPFPCIWSYHLTFPAFFKGTVAPD